MGGVADSSIEISIEPKYDHSYIVKFTAPDGQAIWHTTEIELWSNRKGEDVGDAIVNFIKRKYPKAIIYSVKYV